MEIELSKGTLARLKRLQGLKGYDEQKAIDFAISLAWYITETRQDSKINVPPVPRDYDQ